MGEVMAKYDNLVASSENSFESISVIFIASAEVMIDIEWAFKLTSAPDTVDVPVHNVSMDDNTTEEIRYASYDKYIERLRDKVLGFDCDDMEQPVADLLYANGYLSRVIPKGSDGGRDVIVLFKFNELHHEAFLWLVHLLVIHCTKP